MLTKRIVLVMGLLTMSMARPLLALSNVTQLKADNLNAQSLKFTVTAQEKADGVHFVVIIESDKARLSSLLVSTLTVSDGGNQIASVPVELMRKENSVTCEFVVSEKYLASSTYNFGNISVSNGKAMPAGNFFWFYLKDLAAIK